MKHNYETVVNYLELAYKNCDSSNESSDLKSIISQLINGFNKLIIKNKKRNNSRLGEAKSAKYAYPVETLQILEGLIEKEREKGKSNETIDN